MIPRGRSGGKVEDRVPWNGRGGCDENHAGAWAIYFGYGEAGETGEKAAVRYVLSDAEIAAILAVEGMKLTPEAEERLKQTKSLSPERRLAAIIAAHKPARGR